MKVTKLLKKQEGFTLLELLIVIVIIGILAVMIIPSLLSGPQKARDGQRKSDLRNLKTALEQYYTDYNTYPKASSWKTDLSTSSPGTNDAYMKTVPQDPKSKADYSYTADPSGCDGDATPCTSYSLQTTFENKKDSQATDRSTGAYVVNSLN